MKTTFCCKNTHLDTFSEGFPIGICELWLDLSDKSQKHKSEFGDHEPHIVTGQLIDYLGN